MKYGKEPCGLKGISTKDTAQEWALSLHSFTSVLSSLNNLQTKNTRNQLTNKHKEERKHASIQIAMTGKKSNKVCRHVYLSSIMMTLNMMQ